MLVLVGVVATIVAAGPLWVIVLLALLGYFGGSGERRAENAFTFGPIIEVAVLFAAIFVTMTPVLEMLNAWAQRPDFALTKPWHFFWSSGALSSVLDNAPTYLAFAASAAGLQGIAPHGAYIGTLALDPAAAKLLAAISTGSVFLVGNHFIGNTPNCMFRQIINSAGVQSP